MMPDFSAVGRKVQANLLCIRAGQGEDEFLPGDMRGSMVRAHRIEPIIKIGRIFRTGGIDARFGCECQTRSNYSRRVSGCNAVGGQILRDDRIGADDAATSDRHPRRHRDIDAEPAIIEKSYRTAAGGRDALLFLDRQIGAARQRCKSRTR